MRATADPLLQILATEALLTIFEAADCASELARLEGLEPPTGCLEDMARLSENVPHLGFAVPGVCWDTPAAGLVGVAHGCQAASSCRWMRTPGAEFRHGHWRRLVIGRSPVSRSQLVAFLCLRAVRLPAPLVRPWVLSFDFQQVLAGPHACVIGRRNSRYGALERSSWCPL
jgi:hypothetical protein